MRRIELWTVVFLLLVAVSSGRAQGVAPASGSDALTRVFRGTTDTCIFNDGEGEARNCITGTATFLTEPGTSLRPQRLRSEQVTFRGAGLNLGGATGGWTLQQGEYRQITSYARGITQNLELYSRCRRIGDCANYFYIEHDGGVAAEGDEAVEALGLQANETTSPYVGKLLGTSGVGDRRPALSGAGDQWVTDGGILLDITRGALEGDLSGDSSVLDGYLVQLRLRNAAFPKSKAWGTIVAGYGKPMTLANVSVPVVVDVTLGEIGGKQGKFTPGLVCVAGPEHFEQAVLEDPPAGSPLPLAKPGHQWLRMLIRYPNTAFTSEGNLRSPMLFQGGVCGLYLSADADLRFSNRRTTYPAFGSLDGSDLITGKQVGGVITPYLPQEGSQAWAKRGEGSHFHLFPGAEIVANTGLAPELEPNAVPWTVGDRIESPHHMSVGQNVLFIVDQQSSPTDQSYGGSGITLAMKGKGMAGQHKGIFIANEEATTSYRPYGGPLSPPNALALYGQFGNIQNVYNAPNGALAAVTNCSAAGRFSLFDLPNLRTDHAVKLDYDCATGVVRIPKLTMDAADVTGSLRRAGAEVCTEDGAHCPAAPALRATLAVPALAAGTCATYIGALDGLKETMTITATARGNPGMVTTSTYFAGAGRAGLVVCSPVSGSNAVVYNLFAR